MKRKRVITWSIIACLFACISAAIAYIGYHAYLAYYKPVGRNTEVVYLLVDETTDLAKLRKQIQVKVWPNYPWELSKLIEYYDLGQHLRPGRYAVSPEMSTVQMLQVLLKHEQSPINLDLRAVRTEEELIQVISRQLMMKGEHFRNLLTDSLRLNSLSLDRESVRSLFFAKEYPMLWSISPQALMDTIIREYKTFWTNERLSKAQAQGITPAEASALAAILESESSKRAEYPTIAGLYLNRFRKGMLLQSDPTVKFALGDFSLRRILNQHLTVDSPYNTYKYVGITPGPIRLPQTATIDSVLNAPQHDYLYMCAKEDFSGFHNFAVDYRTHMQNARLYQQALNQRGIR